jgi:transcription termination factor Rho
VSWFRSSRRRRSEPPEGEPAPEQDVPAQAGVPVETQAPAEVPPAEDRPSRDELANATLADLHELAREQGLERYRLLRRDDLIGALASDGEGEAQVDDPPEPAPEIEVRARPPEPLPDVEEEEGEEEAPEPQAESEHEVQAEGILDIAGEGFGFVRGETLLRSDADPFISRTQVRRLGLRAGDAVAGAVRPPRRGERHPAMVRVTRVNDVDAEALAEERPVFEDLQIERPNGPMRMERGSDDVTGRMIDLVAPLGRGQRGLVAGPPAVGASRVLREVARALAGDDPHVIAVLCDVRPEELLDWEPAEGLELHAATAERPPDAQRRVADLALERAKRLAEAGRDVVLLLDSATRLARAHNLAGPNHDDATDPEDQLDGAAVHAVKRWFANARNTRDAGSLTILVAVRTDSDSRLDAAVYESLADTANMELRLDAGLAAAGRHPALDLTRSRTLHEEGLVEEAQLRRLELLRGVVRSLDAEEAWSFLQAKLSETGSNEELLSEQA